MDPMMCYHQYFENSEVHLPPGFRFHPTDEELIAHYLLRKVLDGNFTGRAIAEVNLNKYEPWELPEKAKMGEDEWYFYCLRDRKYPTGLRTNRATEAGYWKATGNDRDIYSSNTGSLVGMKKTLVFYIGRAPNGVRSNWVIHEYRLEGTLAYHYLPRISKDEWVISRVFQRSGAGSGASVNGGVGKNETSRVSIFQEVDSPSVAVMTSQGTRQHVSCINPNYHHHHPPPPFDLIPAPEALGSSSSFPTNTGFSAFPTLRSVEEDIQLSLFLSSTSTPMGMHGGIGGIGAGCFSSGDWVGPEEEREEGSMMAMSPAELDCMWTWDC